VGTARGWPADAGVAGWEAGAEVADGGAGGEVAAGGTAGGAGDAAIAMRLLWVSNIINLILDPCLIFGLGPFPRLGVTGAALATFTGRSIGVMYQFYRLFKGTERIRVLARQIRVHVEVLWRLLRVSFTGILQFAIAHTSWIGLVRIVSTFGAAALAAVGVLAKEVVALTPLIAVIAWVPPGGDLSERGHPSPYLRRVWHDAASQRLAEAFDAGLGGMPSDAGASMPGAASMEGCAASSPQLASSRTTVPALTLSSPARA